MAVCLLAKPPYSFSRKIGEAAEAEKKTKLQNRHEKARPFERNVSEVIP